MHAEIMLPEKMAVIALGSNLYHPVQQIRHALAILAGLPEICCLAQSSLYCTTPIGYAKQPDFINAVVLVQTSWNALGLLQQLQNLEQQFGRDRSFRNAPRTLDLDIIDFNHEILNTDYLTLPHPRAHQRSFVMQPLAEIAPNYVLGEHGTARDLAIKLGCEGVEKLHE